MKLAVRLWSEHEFATSRERWQELLASSSADALFMGWDWQWTWWQHHGATLHATLHLVAVTNEDNRLVGLAPLYLHDARVKRLLRVKRLECLGTAWHNGNAAFSEYFDVVAVREQAAEVAVAIGDWLAVHRDWDDWAVSHVHADALAHKVIARLKEAGSQPREIEALPAHVIDLRTGVGAWLGKLSSDVRRRLHHQRSRLRQPEFMPVDNDDVGPQLQRLQQWRAERHRGDGSGHTVRAFEQALASRLAASGALKLSELRHAGQTLSLMFDARFGDTEYYLAGAFAPDAERGLSPGYLHFGYAIEAAGAEGVKCFDLLAGRGRNRDYKSDLGGEAHPLRSVHVLRAPLLKVLHRVLGSR